MPPPGVVDQALERLSAKKQVPDEQDLQDGFSILFIL